MANEIDIQQKLDEYLLGNPAYPDMRVFSALNGFDPVDVAQHIRGSVMEPHLKELLLNSFIKKESATATTTAVVETPSEWSQRRRSEIRKAFEQFEGSVQEFLGQNPDIPEIQLRNIIGKNLWQQRYEYSRHLHCRKELLAVFVQTEWSVQEFCKQQGISLQSFRAVCPKDLWEQRYDYQRCPKRKINWAEEISALKQQSDSLEDWAAKRGINPQLLRRHLGEEAKLYDRDGRRAAEFDPTLSLKDNAKKLGLSEMGMSRWISKRLKSIDPEKYRKFRLRKSIKRAETDSARVAEFDPALSLSDNAKKLGLSEISCKQWIHAKLKSIDPEKFRRFQTDKRDLLIEDLKQRIQLLNKQLADSRAQISQLEQTISQKNLVYNSLRGKLIALVSDI